MGYEDQQSGDYMASLFVSPFRRFLFSLTEPIHKRLIGNIFSDRVNFIDLEIIRSVQLGIKQVVNVASGLSTYPYRLNMFKDVQFYDLDYASVIEAKKKTLIENGFNPMMSDNVHYIAVDLNHHCDLIQLFKSNFSHLINIKEPTLFILEGILLYLDEKTNLCLLKSISEWGARARLTGDNLMHHTEDVNGRNRLATWMLQGALKLIKEPNKFSFPSTEKLMEEWLKNKVSDKMGIEKFEIHSGRESMYLSIVFFIFDKI